MAVGCRIVHAKDMARRLDILDYEYVQGLDEACLAVRNWGFHRVGFAVAVPARPLTTAPAGSVHTVSFAAALW